MYLYPGDAQQFTTLFIRPKKNYNQHQLIVKYIVIREVAKH